VANIERVMDYPRPPALVADSREVWVVCGGQEIARSRRTFRVLETTHPPSFYIPADDVRREFLAVQARQTFCEWKGVATYWSIVTNAGRRESAAWSYQQPTQAYRSIAGYFSFYPGRTDGCFVDGIAVTPEPGDFYGGWITPEIDTKR
jgi:uncharacterized protein (DUF427 family)